MGKSPNKSLRQQYIDQEKEYIKEKKRGNIDMSKYAENTFLFHFGFYDYPNQTPSTYVPKTLDTKNGSYE